MNQFKIEIASVPDRDKLVAEIWYGTELIAEINHEHNNLEIELYLDGKITFDYQEFINTLKAAKNKLLNPSPKS